MAAKQLELFDTGRRNRTDRERLVELERVLRAEPWAGLSASAAARRAGLGIATARRLLEAHPERFGERLARNARGEVIGGRSLATVRVVWVYQQGENDERCEAREAEGPGLPPFADDETRRRRGRAD